MLLDQALGQIVSVLPEAHPKTALLDILMPYVNALDEQIDDNEGKTLYLPMDTFEKVFLGHLEVELNE